MMSWLGKNPNEEPQKQVAPPRKTVKNQMVNTRRRQSISILDTSKIMNSLEASI